MSNITQWKGTDQQLKRLQVAIAKHCTCDEGKPMCPSHRMLTDQTVMDHLAYAVRMISIYKEAEHHV